MKDSHSIEKQLAEVKGAQTILENFSVVWGLYVQEELNAKRDPGANETACKVCRHLVELETAITEMVEGLREAQPLEEIKPPKSNPASNPDLPF